MKAQYQQQRHVDRDIVDTGRVVVLVLVPKVGVRTCSRYHYVVKEAVDAQLGSASGRRGGDIAGIRSSKSVNHLSLTLSFADGPVGEAGSGLDCALRTGRSPLWLAQSRCNRHDAHDAAAVFHDGLKHDLQVPVHHQKPGC